MKVLWVSHLVPYPPKSGVLLRSYHLVRELSRHVGLDLVAFVQEPWLDLCFGEVQRGLRESEAALAGFCRPRGFLPIPSERAAGGRARLVLTSLLTGSSSTVRWLASPEATRHLAGLAAETPYDLVHFDTISLAQYRHLFPQSRASLGHHNVESHMLARRAEQETSRLRAWLFAQEARRLADYEREAIPQFDIHVTCSALDSARLQAIRPHDRIVDVPNGVDVDYFRPGGHTPIPHTLIFVGTMDWYPNVDAMRFMLAEVWPLLKARRPDITLGIVGRNPPAALTALAADDPSVRFHGYVDDVRPYLEGASLYVCPIRDGGGTKLKVLDALAMAKCIVAHPVACEGIDVVDGRDVVFASEPGEMADRIVELLGDPERAARLGRAGRHLAEARYGFAMLGRQLAEHFRAVVAGVPAASRA